MGSAQAVKAVDTNILVRIIAEDDSRQTRIARDIVETGVHVPLTVLLELGWTLGSRYGFGRAQLGAALSGLLDMESIHVDDEPAIRAALDLHARGADLADCLHLVAARGSAAFVTFDRRLKGDDRIGVDVECLA
jgi:predicted nucleic-acid-binding protein